MNHVIIAFFSLFLLAGNAWADLERRSCGSLYGGLSFIFKKSVTPEKLAKQFESMDWARETYETNVHDRRRVASFYARLKTAPYYSYVSGASGIDVPIGSEDYLAKQLSQTGLVYDVALPWGDCGGAEIAYFSLGKLKDQMSLRQPANFQNVIQSAAVSYVESRRVPGLQRAGITELKSFTVFPIEPHLPLGRVRFRLASEISRDQSSNNTWDQFDVVFNLWKLDEADSLVTVVIEKYKTAPRAGRDNPPSAEFFRDDSEDHWDREYIISGSIAAHFAKFFRSFCVVEGEGFYPGQDGYPASCTEARVGKTR